MNLEELKKDIIIKQKKGLPFIMASVVIWSLIGVIATLNINIELKNILVFCCSTPLLPLAWLIGKKLNVNIFSNDNELSKVGFLFTMNQLLYLLIVMWIFKVVPEKMIMVYAMVFGAHFLPYSWLYDSKAYKIFAISIPIISLILGNNFEGYILAFVMVIIELIFVFVLFKELRSTKQI